tara:strand:+ start:2125 stop:2817 length:693 start_codon:yes stop_codon:yes gene_type:complete
VEVLKLALLGRDIGHSLSPKLYREIYGADKVSYKLFDFQNDLTIPQLSILFQDLDGLNITSPYKQHFLDSVTIQDATIRKLHAINCIAKNGNDFVATNTDYTALLRLLPSMAKGRFVLVLGSGVMARVTAAACNVLEIRHEQWSRRDTPNLFKKMELEKLSEQNILVVNCCAREYTFRAQLPTTALFWDLNYAHQEHELIFSQDKRYSDGLNLLRAQAQDAAAFWSSVKN